MQLCFLEIFGNMSDILFVEVRKMKVKDERFIFQGIYNMLYGIVEFFIVFVEVFRVIEDSDILFVNCLKVGVYIINFSLV